MSVATQQLREYVESLDLLERESILEIVERIEQETDRRRRILSMVQEALAQLRLDMKYLVFDLEATRRERDEARGKK